LEVPKTLKNEAVGKRGFGDTENRIKNQIQIQREVVCGKKPHHRSGALEWKIPSQRAEKMQMKRVTGGQRKRE